MNRDADRDVDREADADEAHSDVEDLRARGPGEDPEDPYADVDVSELPDWWREAIAEFEAAGLRPYRPPRFEDGALTPEVIADLEADLGVDVRFVCFDGRFGDDWAIEVDGTTIADVGRHRSTEGYTRFELPSDEFRAWVREAVTDGAAERDGEDERDGKEERDGRAESRSVETGGDA